jgi:hypothetical protein
VKFVLNLILWAKAAATERRISRDVTDKASIKTSISCSQVKLKHGKIAAATREIRLSAIGRLK